MAKKRRSSKKYRRSAVMSMLGSSLNGFYICRPPSKRGETYSCVKGRKTKWPYTMRVSVVPSSKRVWRGKMMTPFRSCMSKKLRGGKMRFAVAARLCKRELEQGGVAAKAKQTKRAAKKTSKK